MSSRGIAWCVGMGMWLSVVGASGADSPEARFETIRSQGAPVRAWGHPIDARGAFSCDFGLDFTKFTEPLGAEIERDRMFLQRETLAQTVPKDPGMIQKHIPFTQTSSTTAFSGGRYLFQGREQAATYATYIKRRYTYPGNTQFLQRPEFSDPECRDWSVVVAWNFVPVEAHTAMRTERFDTGLTTLDQELRLSAELFAVAPSIVATAQARGYGEVHLLHSLEDHKVQLVYFEPRVSPPDPNQPDVAALTKIAGDPQLGADLASRAHLTRVFDRAGLVLTIWQPYEPGDHGKASLWPNSPPIPAPACGDAVCEPSRGETGDTCPQDCAPRCGDAVCQPDENESMCPSDCGSPFVP